MPPEQLRSTLAKLHFTARWSDAAAIQLAAILRAVEFPAARVIFSEGEFQPDVYLIAEGEVALEMCVPARGCTRILTLGPGDLLAWSAALGPGQMTATAIAMTEVRVLAASSLELRALCETDFQFGYEFMRAVASAVSKRLVATRLQLLDLYDPPAGRQSANSIFP